MSFQGQARLCRLNGRLITGPLARSLLPALALARALSSQEDGLVGALPEVRAHKATVLAVKRLRNISPLRLS